MSLTKTGIDYLTHSWNFYTGCKHDKTVCPVAAKLGRKAVGYEISESYCKLIVERNNQMALSEVTD